MSAHADKLPLIHGLIDGELDAANTLAIETHLRGCGDCRAELDRLQALRGTLASAPLRNRAPDSLLGRIGAMLEAESDGPAKASMPSRHRTRSFAAHVLSPRWASGAITGALAASLVLAVGLPQLTQSNTEDQLIQSHVRSLLVGHVVDVETSNRHVVKPWFNGKVDFAPSVPELAGEGFPLVGGRLDYVDNQQVAAIVYRRRLHTINLFVRPAKTLSSPVGFTNRREGYNIAHWSAGGLDYWAISDLDSRELDMFRHLYSGRIER